MSFICKVSIPDKDISKMIKVVPGDTVWDVKIHLLKKIGINTVENGVNYGLYLNPMQENVGGFLEDHRLMFEYQLPNNVALDLKIKTREVKNIPQKQLEKWNSKKEKKSLLEWIHKKSYNKVKDAISKGMDPNFVWPETGETPLTLATLNDDAQMILVLVQMGSAFVDYRSADWKTPLHKAVKGNNVRALNTLLSLGAPPNLKDKEGQTPLYLAAILNRAECADALLEAGSIFDTTDDNGRSELHQACLSDSPGVTKVLCEFGTDFNRANSTKNTPLHVAASSNSLGCVKILLEYGANPNLQNATGDTPHDAAITATYWEIADVIGSHKPENVAKLTPRQPTKIVDINLGSAPILKIDPYIPPPPPPGYKGICAAPLDAPVR